VAIIRDVRTFHRFGDRAIYMEIRWKQVREIMISELFIKAYQCTIIALDVAVACSSFRPLNPI